MWYLATCVRKIKIDDFVVESYRRFVLQTETQRVPPLKILKKEKRFNFVVIFYVIKQKHEISCFSIRQVEKHDFSGFCTSGNTIWILQ